MPTSSFVMLTVNGVFAGTARQYWFQAMLWAVSDKDVPFGAHVTLAAASRCCLIHAW